MKITLRSDFFLPNFAPQITQIQTNEKNYYIITNL